MARKKKAAVKKPTKKKSIQKRVNSRKPPVKKTIKAPPRGKSEGDVAERKKIYIESYIEEWCNITVACDNSKISRTTVYNWINNDPNFSKALDELKEIRIDYVEKHLNENIKKGNVTAQIFFLKTIAKHRGYIERTELAGPGGGPINMSVSRDDISEEALSSALLRMIQDSPELKEAIQQQEV